MKIITLTSARGPKEVQLELQSIGLWTRQVASATGEVMLLVEPQSSQVEAARVMQIAGVADVLEPKSAHPKLDAQGAKVSLGSWSMGHPQQPVLMAGPCSVESEAQIHESARMVYDAGATVLRGGCFKPRTSPYSFSGVGVEGLVWMREAADAHGLLVVTEAMSSEQVEPVARFADLIQVGARNMQNFALLHAIGRAGKPILLKRGLSATIEEWLLAAEHALAAGASQVIFCERGIRSFDDSTRFLLDLSAVALLLEHHDVPVIVDPSHAAGRKDLIPRLGLASLAMGAHGLIIETHPDPSTACSDGPQQLNPQELRDVAKLWSFARQAKSASQGAF